MKTCVFITGTNAVGKTTLAREIMKRCGGIADMTKTLTLLADGKTCFAGRYGEKSGGVDRMCTGALADVVAEGMKTHDTVFCEGSYLDTFGMNLLNALFKGDRSMVVNLYADARTLAARRTGRTGRTGDDMTYVLRKNRRTMLCARKYQSIGVPVLQFDTGKVETQEIADAVLNALNK